MMYVAYMCNVLGMEITNNNTKLNMKCALHSFPGDVAFGLRWIELCHLLNMSTYLASLLEKRNAKL